MQQTSVETRGQPLDADSEIRNCAMKVLCTTSTLAMGVNLPAHLVVLKGTRRWTAESGETAGYQEYDRSTCLQMIGRAGRPQFDTEGVAVIMTQKQVTHAQICNAHGFSSANSNAGACDCHACVSMS